MRKNLYMDEPDNRWTDREIMVWAIKNGIADEAHSICNQEQQVIQASGQSKRPQ